jgi:hypothetical protein
MHCFQSNASWISNYSLLDSFDYKKEYGATDFITITDFPAQRPPRLNDHPFYTQNSKIAPFITQPKQVRLPSN